MPPMNLKRLLRSWKRGTFQTIRLTVFILIVAALIVNFTFWFYENYKQGLGDHLARVAIAYHAVLFVGMVLFGLGVGYGIEWLILHRKFIFHDPQPDSLAEWIMILWGVKLPPLEKEPQAASESDQFQYLNRPTRRGRKPTFTLDRWLPIAAKWENRDPMRDAFTLAELIADHLGTNPDGSPIVSEQIYYSLWRARAIEELKRRSRK
jgi:hypothetical protein